MNNKIFIILVFVFILIFKNSTASDIDKQDIIIQSIFTILTCADWYQTKEFIKKGGEELNPVLGKYPSQERIDIFIFSAIMAHATISYILPKNARIIWQTTLISAEIRAIDHNFDKPENENYYIFNFKFVINF